MFSPKIIRSQYKNLPIPPASSITGRTFIVTGANTGLGFECASHLVRLSAERVILAVRSQARGDAAKAKIEATTGCKGVAEVWLLDLASHSSVQSFAKKACSELARIDGVIENASIAVEDWSTAEGMETTLTVNVISTYLLAMLLLPKLKASAIMTSTIPHLTIVSSGAGFFVEGVLEPIQGDILEALNTEGRFPMAAERYSVSKLLQIYATRELASLLPISETSVVINYLSPGLCSTDLARNANLRFRMMLGVMRALMGRTAEMGSRTLLHAVVAGKESHGKYMNHCQAHEDEVPTWVTSAKGEKIQTEIWKNIVSRLEMIVPGCIQKALEA